MPATMNDATDLRGFMEALGRELSSEASSFNRLAETATGKHDLVEVEAALMQRAHEVWNLAMRCKRWREQESERLAKLAEKLGEGLAVGG